MTICAKIMDSLEGILLKGVDLLKTRQDFARLARLPDAVQECQLQQKRGDAQLDALYMPQGLQSSGVKDHSTREPCEQASRGS